MAIRHDVDVLDIKEPAQGSLGRATSQAIRQILEQVKPDTLVSVALGEIGELDQFAIGDFLTECDPAGRIRFAKVGHAQMAGCQTWGNRWQRFVQELPVHVLPVAVGYVDQRDAAAPPLDEIICRGSKLGCRVVLFDTWNKASGNIFDHLDVPDLRGFRQTANALGMNFVLAGSVRNDCLSAVAEVAPQVVGIRGAACHKFQRGATIDGLMLSRFRSRLNEVQRFRRP